MSDNGWPEYKQMVLSELRSLNTTLNRITEEQTRLRIEVERLKMQAGLWGLLAGGIPVILALAVHWIKGAP